MYNLSNVSKAVNESYMCYHTVAAWLWGTPWLSAATCWSHVESKSRELLKIMLWKLSLSYMCRTLKVCKCDKMINTFYRHIMHFIFKTDNQYIQNNQNPCTNNIVTSWFSIHLLANCGVCFCLKWYNMWLFSNSNRQHLKEVTPVTRLGAAVTVAGAKIMG